MKTPQAAIREKAPITASSLTERYSVSLLQITHYLWQFVFCFADHLS
jgi:hypothetical protein